MNGIETVDAVLANTIKNLGAKKYSLGNSEEAKPVLHRISWEIV
jgi:hypothetical protein